MKRIMIAEDNVDLLKFTETLVSYALPSNEISHCDLYSDAYSALEAVETRAPYDIVITDFNIPRGNEGLKIARAARDKSPDTVIVILSGMMGKPDCRGYEDCIDAFIKKPYTLRELQLALASRKPVTNVVPIGQAQSMAE